MPLAQCERCSKMFQKTKIPVCQKCLPQEEEDYEKIRDALQASPNQTAQQISDNTGIDLRCVMRLIEDGRITSTASHGSIRCGKCGAPAISLAKKLCETCLNQLNADVAKAQAKIHLPKKRDVELGTALNVSEGTSIMRKTLRSGDLK
jgi:NMD protein affecting ribosome stability and mRNA decay